MNRSLHLLLCFCIGLTVALPARAQTLRAGIPAEAKEAADPTGHRQVIEQFVKTQVEQLKRVDDHTAQAAARDALVNETLHNNEPADVPFLNFYASLLNQALVEQIAGHAEMRVRLLGAIVAGRVAERADNAQLRQAAKRFLDDESEAVVLWGVKTAGGVMPAVMRNPMWVQENPLADPVVEAVRRFSSGPIVQEAYGAFMMRILAQPPQPAPPAVLQATIDPIHRVFAIRIERYRAGVPEEPMVENRVTLFLTERGVWTAQKPDQQIQTVQLTSDLLWLACDLATKNEGERERLIPVVRQCGRALWVVGQAKGDTRLQQAVQPAINLGINDPPQVVRQVGDDVHAAARNAFNGLRPPQGNDAAVLTGSN